MTADDMLSWGIANRIFPVESFQADVAAFLEEQLEINDGKSMMEARRLMNAPLRDGRMIAVVNAMDALAERVVDGAMERRFAEKRAKLEAKSQGKSKL